jgi:hypothetical protein
MRNKLSRYALAVIVALSLGASMVRAEEKPKGPVVTFNGGLDVYYMLNTTGSDPAIGTYGRIFDQTNNTFRTSLAKFSIDAKEGNVGGHIDLIYGQTADVMYGTKTGTAVALESAYVSYSPTAKLSLSAGKFPTLIGYEVIESWVNPNYSRSFAFGYTIPFEHTGVKGTYTFSDKVNASAMVANTGWSDEASLNSSKTVLLQVIANPVPVFGFVANVITGPDAGTYTNKTVGNFIVNVNPTSKLYLGADLTLGSVEGDPDNYSFNSEVFYLTYLLTPAFKAAARYELYSDEDVVTGLAPKASDATLTLGYKVGNLNPRAEFRYDQFEDADGNLLGTQRTYTMGIAYTF